MKIEEIEDSQESEEDFKKIDEYVKKKVREDNIIKTPEIKPKSNSSKEIPNIEISPEISVSDRKDLIKKINPNENEHNDNDEKEAKNYIHKESSNNNNNKILSLLNMSKENQQIESKLIIDRNSIMNNPVIEDNHNKEISSKTVENISKKSRIELKKTKDYNNSNSIDHPIFMDDSVIEKKSHKKKSPKKTQKRSKSKKIYEAIEPNSYIETISTHNDIPINFKDVIFGEKIESQYERLKKVSPFGNFNTFKLFKLIIKNGEDLRQEQFATQLINEFYQIFQLEEVDIWLKPYEILSTGHNVGLIECVPNAVSLDYLKRKSKNINNLSQFYESYFGPKNSESKYLFNIEYKNAISNFIKSLAGYSLVCYFLQIKDRHNGNILIDDQGHIIHIDFGFMLSNAPGKGIQFEKAPFKLTKEFVDVIGGVKTENFSKFRKLLWKY